MFGRMNQTPYRPPYEWIGFSAENGTVGKFEATFGRDMQTWFV